jgi:ribosome production factor 2
MEARSPKEVEDARTCIFVRGTHTGEVAGNAMKELVRRHPIYSFYPPKP